mmetsp:Transcript_20373/g.48438  ORF Transcript_20373/g.48438 Transcript_20373/m.48438 type:complete len:431 (-) Transcript_20373:1500-2792(-)
MTTHSTMTGAPTQTGNLSFCIRDFNFHTKDMQPGETMETAPVEFAGEKWSIRLVECHPTRHMLLYVQRKGIGCDRIHDILADVSVSFLFYIYPPHNLKFKGLQPSLKLPYSLDMNRLKDMKDDGSFLIKVCIKMYEQLPKQPSDNCWYPNIDEKNYFLIEMFNESDEKKDLQLLVGQTVFPVHRFVIEKRAPALFEIINEFTGHGPIPVGEVDHNMFAIAIKSIYDSFEYKDAGVWKSLEQTQAVLSLADRFGCSKLKMYAESVLVDEYLTTETIGSLLVLADSYSCPFLKEAAQQIYLKDPVAVSKTDGWEQIASKSPKLMRELMDGIFSITSPNFATSEDWKKMMINEKPTVLADFMHSILETKNGSMVSTNSKTDQADDADVNKWSVTKLRRELSKERLDLDGSKEILVQRWNEHTNGNSMETTTTG